MLAHYWQQLHCIRERCSAALRQGGVEATPSDYGVVLAALENGRRGIGQVSLLSPGIKREFLFLTEEEARKRWCPYGVQPIVQSLGHTMAVVAANRQERGDVPACLASLCMAWRYATPKQLRDVDLVTSDVVDEQPRRGYCGAFGVPTVED